MTRVSSDRRVWPFVVLLTAALVPRAAAQDRGELLGWVEDASGDPVSGVLVSLFGKGVPGASFVAFSDDTGRFFLPALPAGSYTLRAVTDRLSAPLQTVTVLPNQSSVFTLSLRPSPEAAEDESEANSRRSPREREWAWLLRHKRRSILEQTERAPLAPGEPDSVKLAAAYPAQAPLVDELSASFELVTTPAALEQQETNALSGTALPTSLGVVKVSGRLAGNAHWSLGGLLAESENNTWRVAGEFVVEPGTGHLFSAGLGYGTHAFATPFVAEENADSRSTGAVFAQDRWQVTRSLTAGLGARYSFVGFLEQRNHVDPSLELAWTAGRDGVVRAGARSRTLIPGGDLLTLSTLAVNPAIANAVLSPDLRAQQTLRYDVAFDRRLGTSTILSAQVFEEEIRDRLASVFTDDGRSLSVANAGSAQARGVGLSLTTGIGSVQGSLAYAYGQSLGKEPHLGDVLPDGEFHDVVARVEAFIQRSGTRVDVYYRVNTLQPDDETQRRLTQSRFDVRVRQGIPFLGSLTSADWDVLLALRNLFYEEGDGGTLDELAVANPPTRVLGGIAVRF
jgi:hypothetical protein